MIRNAFIEGQDKCFDLTAVHPLGHKKIRNDPDFRVRAEGLEPPCLAAPDPKSGASANFATPACKAARIYYRQLECDESF